MTRYALLILIDHRQQAAVNVQKTLTAWGCIIKARLGLHEGVLEHCSDTGLIFCELTGEDEKRLELTRKLNLIKGVKAEHVPLTVEE
ncbi:hypothetical protein P0136_00455 [Lentisphaerota bacterium ZTH]|nr:hypothetical protein JYG24_08400 [Lentisphaerota bacterium]WET06485.1 hypothetical protein P0136_00455 [Lentisphaerota bacterium ZTH]